MRRLLSIEDVFEIDGRGLVVLPTLAWGSGRTMNGEKAELRRPDGRVVPFELHVHREHYGLTPDAVRAGRPSLVRVCELRGIARTEVAIGSEIWCADWIVEDAAAEPVP